MTTRQPDTGRSLSLHRCQHTYNSTEYLCGAWSAFLSWYTLHLPVARLSETLSHHAHGRSGATRAALLGYVVRILSIYSSTKNAIAPPTSPASHSPPQARSTTRHSEAADFTILFSPPRWPAFPDRPLMIQTVQSVEIEPREMRPFWNVYPIPSRYSWF